jgi:dTDP-glucose pyrophosphorylase
MKFKDIDEAWRAAILPPTALLANAIETLNETAIKIVLCADSDGRLLGTVTDGDIRRGLINGLTTEIKIIDVANKSPLVLPQSAGKQIALEIMKANNILQIPVVDENSRIVGLHLWSEIDSSERHNHSMVIMAGGKGTRLRPLTEDCPKPMLSVAGKPMLQHIIERAQSQGFQFFILSINYLGQKIRDYFGTGSDFGVHISYIEESEPLELQARSRYCRHDRTALLWSQMATFLTDIDYRQLIEFHQAHAASGVMAVRQYEWVNPYGVVEMQGVDITGFTEKPMVHSHINAGVYALSPSALDHLKSHTHCDMPALFDRIRTSGMRTVAYPMHEPWLDIGRPDDLAIANEDLS